MRAVPPEPADPAANATGPVAGNGHSVSRGVSRRGFVFGGAAAVVLAACGGSADDAADVAPQLVSLFSSDHVIAAGIVQRIPFAVVDIGDLDIDDTVELPVTISFEGDTIETTSVVGRLVDHDHRDDEDPDHRHADLLRYFALRTELPEPGVYDIEVDFGTAAPGRLPIQAFDPASVPVPLPGQPMPSITTPTTASPEGISPLCTRYGEPCSFHEHNVADLLGAGRPLALLVATPALCTTAYCGPVLETLIGVAEDHPGIDYVHLEVYANADEVDSNYDDPRLELAAPVTELGLTFEPSLFLVTSDGTLMERIDNIYDAAELGEALSALT
ncbi:MAG: hypothetical protein ACR2QO_09545 [Acidimicrobiales bacterium]